MTSSHTFVPCLVHSDVYRRMLCDMTDSEAARPEGWVPDLLTFGARLALVRQRMGWTNVKEAAISCSIAPETWRRWETGKFEPRGLIAACMKIAGVTGVDYRWLALGPDDRSATDTSQAVGNTLRYPALGERVVAVGRPDRVIDDVMPRGIMRTRPIDRACVPALVG